MTNTPSQFVNGYVSRPLTGIMHLFGGYQGPTLPLLCFLGVGVLIVVIGGSIIWRHDRRLWFFGLLALVAAVLSLGVTDSYWTPWRVFTHLAVLNNVVPVNISVIIDTCVAIMLAVVVAHAHEDVDRRAGSTAATVAGWAVVALALVPVAVAFWPNVPITVRAATTPRWFTAHAPAAHGQVLLPYPAALGGIQSSMAWQAMTGTTFSMVGGGGPGIAPSRAGPESAGFDVLARASFPLSPAPGPSEANLTAIRNALRGWGVTTIVVPDQPGLPTYARGRPVPYAVGLFTAALGRPPRFETDAWVWTGVARPGAPVPLGPSQFAACTDPGSARISEPAVASCVLAHR